MKNTSKLPVRRPSLRIHRETLRRLTQSELAQVAGGIQLDSGWSKCEGDCPRTTEF